MSDNTSFGGGGVNSGFSISKSGIVVPTYLTYVGGNKGGLLTGFLIDGSGNLEVSVQNSNPNGQTTSTQSSPVVPASDWIGNFNLSQLNGATPADVNPFITISDIQQMILNGKGFSCSTGKVAGAVNLAFSWFSGNTSTKNKIIWLVRQTYSNANQLCDFRYITVDDANIVAGTSVIGQAINLKGGGSAPEAATVMHYASGVAAPAIGATTEPLDTPNIQSSTTAEIITQGMLIYIPAGTAGGIAGYTSTTAAGFYSTVVRWTEFF